jgi:hypothetical protein
VTPIPAGARVSERIGTRVGQAQRVIQLTIGKQPRIGGDRRQGEGVRFACDSPLEGDGFEPSVPRTSNLIVVDDQRLLAQDAVRAPTTYRGLLQRLLGVHLWPGDRGAAKPEHLAGPQGDERFVIAPRLRNLCHACAVIGCVRYAFDIDHSAKFLGIRRLSVTKRRQ